LVRELDLAPNGMYRAIGASARTEPGNELR
jgi:hypothetical protein